MAQVHQDEGEIVQDIRRGDLRIEFDRIEGHRLSIDQRDIGEMQVAVAVADEATAFALLQGGANVPERIMACAVEKHDALPIEMTGEGCGIGLDQQGDRFDPGRFVGDGRLVVSLRDRIGQFLGQPAVDGIRLRQPVERQVLVEPDHVDGPFDDVAGAGDVQPAAGAPRDGRAAAIDLRREPAIDLDLALAGILAFGQR